MSERSLSTGKIVTFLVGATVFIGLGLVFNTQFTGSDAKTQRCQPKAGVLATFQPSEERRKAPDAVIFDNDEKERRLTDYVGRGVVLNFWATWCAPCVKEMPQLDRLNAILKSSGIDVLTVSEDRQGLPVVRKFFVVSKLRHLEILADPKGNLLRALDGRGLPTTVIFDHQGFEVGRVTGIAEWDAPETVGFLKQCLGP